MTQPAKQILRQKLNEQLIAGQTAAKWIPREKSSKGSIAREIMQFFGMTPRQYRKQLAELTNVVETQMCQQDWDNINFSHVPSQASRIYRNAFKRNTPKFAEYVAKLASGDKSVSIAAGAIFPHDVIKGVGDYEWDKTKSDHVIAQWNALPNYVGDSSILPLVDVSGSMTCPVGGYGSGNSTTCMDVAVGLGLYLADKNKGVFKDTFLTFSDKPTLMTLKGNIVQKLDQMKKSEWGMSTNLNAAFNKILDTAVKANAPQGDMPKILLVLSDMQFNLGVKHDETAMQMIERKYKAAGYELPAVAFWNLNSNDNVPVKADKSGAALVSGFSPSIMTAVLSADMEEFSPEGIMMRSVMIPRYDLN